MFEDQVSPSRFSPPLFVAQLVLAPFGSLICGFLGIEMVQAKSNFVAYVAFLSLGFVLGYKMQVSFPRAIHSGGGWVWIPPACILLAATVSDSRAFGQAYLLNYFWPTMGPALKGMELYLCTLPAIATCFYSIGAKVAAQADHSSWRKFFRRALARP